MLIKTETPAWIAKGKCTSGHDVEAVVPAHIPASMEGQEAQSYCPVCKETVMLLIPAKPSATLTLNYKP